ncbi:MAG: biopolymer transporter ExbD [Geothrix sp.]|jgi:biopolymer transport protein ExbD|uniref:Biopolymer transporter ExbD n=1 Tax=Candidatus Geothrix odensensis TaxID=2954440 RepID=A0A936F4N1_9BACT|nr:biopolymer transporter ExbD [Candidatus Geothrix odensensis]MCC6513466.1 biopolymer transporter ExbD [Geothrix sp.]
MDAGGAKGKQKSDINVTPLIDIVLVLLIVFIVMVPGLDKATKVVVPQVVVQQKVTPPDPNNILIQMDQDGSLMLQQDKIDAQGLKDRLPEAVMLQPLGYRKVFLKVDEDVRFQAMVDVLDTIRVASNTAKQKSLENQDKFLGQDGGDVKVAVSLKKRPASATAPVS